jgi:RimJ/RimL family protein N-acetyltransferase
MISTKTDVISPMTSKPSNIILNTGRLIIREHQLDDIAAVEAYSTQEKFWQYLQVGELTAGAGKAYIERVIAEQALRPRTEFNLALTHKNEGGVLGNIRFGVTDLENGEGIIGYALAPEHWGKGYASEAVKAIIDFAFSTILMHRLYALVDIENKGSINVLEKCGFTYEGTLRENKISKGTRRSTHIYSLLAHEVSG